MTDLKERISNEITLDDAILALFYSTNQEVVTKNSILLFKAFYEIKKENEIAILNKLIFDNNGEVPWSNELYSSFARLEISELLPYITSGNKLWYFLNWTRKEQEKSFMKFDAKEKGQIITAARTLKKLPVPNK